MIVIKLKTIINRKRTEHVKRNMKIAVYVEDVVVTANVINKNVKRDVKWFVLFYVVYA
jgi:hypothetical protein